jgi:RNA polymerase sigma-70 factor, ECF subfamily
VPKTNQMAQLSDMSDAQLVVSVARQNDHALAEIYGRHSRSVFGVARKILGDSAEAEDVTQEIFLRLWNSPERFDASRASLRTFLVIQAHGRAVDVVRARAARQRREIQDARSAPAAAYDLEREVWDHAMAERVTSAVADLPDQERIAIGLAYFEGHTYREVAQLLEEPEGTVKTWIRNGLRRMRTAMLAEGVHA